MPRSTYRAEAEHGRLVDIDLLTHAIAFAGAADAYRRTVPQAPDWKPSYFLMARSIELALKAHALNVGDGHKQLRDLGHDLLRARDHAEQRGLSVPLTNEETKSLSVLSFWYREHYLAYPLRRPQAFPRPRLARTIVDKILAAVYVAVLGSAAYEGDKDDPKHYGLSIDESAAYGD